MFWIAGWKFDSNGVARLVPLYGYSKEKYARGHMSAIGRHMADPTLASGKENLQRELRSLEGFFDFQVMTPAEYVDRYSRAKVAYHRSVLANEGHCPSCDHRKFDRGLSTKFGFVAEGHLAMPAGPGLRPGELSVMVAVVDGRKGRRCRKCGHVWFKVKNPHRPRDKNFGLTKAEKKILEAAGLR